jgi:hypothetical protein
MYRVEVSLDVMNSLLNFINSTNCFKTYNGGTQSDKMVAFTSIFKECILIRLGAGVAQSV